MVVGATEITNSMIASASAALAASLNEDDIRSRRLVPEVARLWDVCGDVALAVAGQAIDEGVARMHDTDVLEKTIASKRWQPAYPQLFSTMEPG